MTQDDVLDSIRGTHDSLSVRRCYGDPVVLDGIIAVCTTLVLRSRR